MTIVKNWMAEAAEEIASHWKTGSGKDDYISDAYLNDVRDNITRIIEAHCPFKKDTAYTEVVEPPLLQCVDCKNTESCAGAMARYFNHGRCLCGGYFKVVRA